MKTVATRWRQAVLVGGLCVGLSACQSAPPPVDPDVLAAWPSGEIRVSDLDAHLLSQPVKDRQPPPGMSSRRWLEDHIRQLFERQVMLADTSPESLDDDAAFQESWQDKRQQVLVRLYERRHNAPFEVTPEMVQAYFDEHADTWRTAEKRIFQNLLVAFGPDASEAEKDARCAEAEDIRRQIVGGASFSAMVKEHSDSSNAATGGLVAAMEKSQLRGEVGELLFALEPGDVSRVLRNRAGCQLFYVRQVIPAIEPKVELLQEEIAKTLADDERRQWRRELIEREAEAQGVALPSALAPDAETDWQSVSIDEPLFSLGEQTLTLRDLIPEVREGSSPKEALERAVSHALFAAAMRNLEEPWIEERVAAAKEGHRFEVLRRRALHDYLTAQPDGALRTFYDDNKGRYFSDPRLELTIYTWRIGKGDPLSYLQRPRDFAQALKARPEAAEELWQKEVAAGGVERLALPQQGLRELLTQRPELSAVFMEEHTEGDILGPHRSGNFIYLASINVYIPPRQLSFLEVRSQVQVDFIAERGDAMALEWSQTLADEQGLKIYDEHLENFGRRLVEQLMTGAP